MLVRCSLCGGENEREPGQEMLACSFCGSALALEKPRSPEHLILEHKRDVKAAESVLRSFLLEQERRRPASMTTELSFKPFAMIESGDGEGSIVAAFTSGTLSGGVPYPPAGHYRFFDESSAPAEKIIPVARTEKDTVRILHLPVYTIRYEAGTWKGSAAVIGESWQVIAGALPPPKPRAVNPGLFFAGAGLFIAYLLLGRLASGMLGRLGLITAASVGGFVLYNLHERMSRRA